MYFQLSEEGRYREGRGKAIAPPFHFNNPHYYAHKNSYQIANTNGMAAE